MEEITRMTLSPLFISHKCKRCHKFAYYAIKCPSCSVSYHYECAFMRRECCGVRLLNGALEQPCAKCKVGVYLGPQCTHCGKKYHSFCISPYERCCNLNLCEPPAEKACGKCEQGVLFGPRCPLCGKVYHSYCTDNDKLICCKVKVLKDENVGYHCYKCQKKVLISTPMCQFCGKVCHKKCLRGYKGCCRDSSLELLLIPSFKYMASYFKQFERKRAQLVSLEMKATNHTHILRSMTQNFVERGKNRDMACQTPHPLDNVEITDVKTETEDDSDLPPILEKETYAPILSPLSSFRLEIISEEEDTLKELFDFLYKKVNKFPPQLQAQVRVNLFKVVTEAEMKLKST
ncbi:histone-lysine N-methyltransferase 2C-like isoform X2 [Tribolium madens]|nr:histone-lysine N-methyltransferase 2C-like isoform X2 [Tribolium madens]